MDTSICSCSSSTSDYEDPFSFKMARAIESFLTKGLGSVNSHGTLISSSHEEKLLVSLTALMLCDVQLVLGPIVYDKQWLYFKHDGHTETNYPVMIDTFLCGDLSWFRRKYRLINTLFIKSFRALRNWHGFNKPLGNIMFAPDARLALIEAEALVAYTLYE